MNTTGKSIIILLMGLNLFLVAKVLEYQDRYEEQLDNTIYVLEELNHAKIELYKYRAKDSLRQDSVYVNKSPKEMQRIPANANY